MPGREEGTRFFQETHLLTELTVLRFQFPESFPLVGAQLVRFGPGRPVLLHPVSHRLLRDSAVTRDISHRPRLLHHLAGRRFSELRCVTTGLLLRHNNSVQSPNFTLGHCPRPFGHLTDGQPLGGRAHHTQPLRHRGRRHRGQPGPHRQSRDLRRHQRRGRPGAAVPD